MNMTAKNAQPATAMEDLHRAVNTTMHFAIGECGSTSSAKEVARACAANALAVAIPCHRVVKKDEALSGWGVKRKRVLLEREVRS